MIVLSLFQQVVGSCISTGFRVAKISVTLGFEALLYLSGIRLLLGSVRFVRRTWRWMHHTDNPYPSLKGLVDKQSYPEEGRARLLSDDSYDTDAHELVLEEMQGGRLGASQSDQLTKSSYSEVDEHPNEEPSEGPSESRGGDVGIQQSNQQTKTPCDKVDDSSQGLRDGKLRSRWELQQDEQLRTSLGEKPSISVVLKQEKKR
ncbi:hypothetical protein K461DRAFT_291171 [Myriangium duriaei CBS 260.36]|uniref:Uncharacterized protein n=1 Tax=Myriangium duriaei CBS 260.36 TaxID=1168546 RepID=A0A9P4J7M7_9PEZI|nr:hypothetical protein K461DRAFT_291171 [Myriangium duriaei CBS 260.36]